MEISILSQMTEYFNNNIDSYLLAIWEHISISAVALLIAVIIGVPTGFICARFRYIRKWVMAFFQVLYIIPSLAILLLLIPVMGTGVRPATTALVILAVPPILLNTTAGLSNVPDSILETASGCGMTSGQVWQKVRFPLALPMMLAGIKTAFIVIIASATLAAKIGAGGLGGLIFTGLGLYRFDLLFIGGLTVALLSICAGLIMDLFDKLALPYKHNYTRGRV
jgi:osmoprotectant transport system permease protein